MCPSSYVYSDGKRYLELDNKIQGKPTTKTTYAEHPDVAKYLRKTGQLRDLPPLCSSSKRILSGAQKELKDEEQRRLDKKVAESEAECYTQ